MNRSGQALSPPCKGGVAAASIKKSRSHRSAADGGRSPRKPDRAQPSIKSRQPQDTFQNAFRNIACERPPRPRLFGTGPFLYGAATPPWQGGESAQTEHFAIHSRLQPLLQKFAGTGLSVTVPLGSKRAEHNESGIARNQVAIAEQVFE